MKTLFLLGATLGLTVLGAYAESAVAHEKDGGPTGGFIYSPKPAEARLQRQVKAASCVPGRTDGAQSEGWVAKAGF